ncbi:MAG: GNAT family N-acetyltransferase [Marivirga sp.]|nr:GNAT family N-acetyltransferase [Marivirga sp.]
MIQIQKAAPEHIDTLIEFQQRLAFESEGVNLHPDTLRSGMNAMFTDPSKGSYYIAQEDGLIVGCHSVTFEWSDWRNGMVWWLQSVYVRESHRKKGIFKMMYDNLINTIQHNPELIGLRLYVDKSNERAMKVYESMGMDGSHYTVYEWMK